MHPLTLVQFEYRLALALALGAVLGLERQLHHKAAGTKTHALVALGAALFVLLAEAMPGDSSATGRVAGQIITGIGFLGAGAILRRDAATVTGLTTAATVWCAGAIGTLAGLGSWYQAVIGTGFILTANVLLRPLDRRIDRLGRPQLDSAAAPGAASADGGSSSAEPPAAPRHEVQVALHPNAGTAVVSQVLGQLLAQQPQALLVEAAEPVRVRATVPGSAQTLAALLAALQATPGVAGVKVGPGA